MRNLTILACLCLLACDPPPGKRVDTPEVPDARLALLFQTPEGCSVYRFYDVHRYVHFVICPSGTATADEEVVHEQTGKRQTTRVVPHSVPVVRAPATR